MAHIQVHEQHALFNAACSRLQPRAPVKKCMFDIYKLHCHICLPVLLSMCSTRGGWVGGCCPRSDPTLLSGCPTAGGSLVWTWP